MSRRAEPCHSPTWTANVDSHTAKSNRDGGIRTRDPLNPISVPDVSDADGMPVSPSVEAEVGRQAEPTESGENDAQRRQQRRQVQPAPVDAPTGAAVAPGSRAVVELLAYLADAVNADECAPAHWDTAVALAQAVGRLRADAERLEEWKQYALHLERVLADLRVVASDLYVARDTGRNARVGKMVAALDGELPGFDERIDAFRDFYQSRPNTDHARAAGGDAGAGRAQP